MLLKEVAGLYGLDDLTAEEEAKLKEFANLEPAKLQADMVKMLANRANLGFTTGDHWGRHIPIFFWTAKTVWFS
ncbi:hypothetical protein [Peribacillus glennii]|uniref:hypothetical protein n=1 Tax=Peribacillus glennii TaxID=2303991 RepID=UPI00389A4B2D